MVHKTEYIRKTLSPTWKPFTVLTRTLCNGDIDRCVIVPVLLCYLRCLLQAYTGVSSYPYCCAMYLVSYRHKQVCHRTCIAVLFTLSLTDSDIGVSSCLYCCAIYVVSDRHRQVCHRTCIAVLFTSSLIVTCAHCKALSGCRHLPMLSVITDVSNYTILGLTHCSMCHVCFTRIISTLVNWAVSYTHLTLPTIYSV